MKNAKQIAYCFGISPEQLKAQYQKNIAQLSQMQAKAQQSGKKVNGYTSAQLADKITAITYQSSQL